MKKLEKIFSEISPLDLLKFLLTLTGINLKYIIETLWPSYHLPIIWAIIISAVVLFLFSLMIGKKELKKRFVFEAGSNEEAAFFRDWYSKEGNIIMFCTDLEWLENDNFELVVSILKKKGDKLSLYLKEYKENKIVNELLLSGAKLYPVKKSIRSEHRFSIRKNNGFRSIIIRNKQFEPNKIQIEAFPNNRILVDLALDMLDDCLEPIGNLQLKS